MGMSSYSTSGQELTSWWEERTGRKWLQLRVRGSLRCGQHPATWRKVGKKPQEGLGPKSRGDLFFTFQGVA